MHSLWRGHDFQQAQMSLSPSNKKVLTAHVGPDVMPDGDETQTGVAVGFMLAKANGE